MKEDACKVEIAVSNELEEFQPSLKLLGSKELESEIISDLDELIRTSEERGLRPLYLVIGRLFLSVGIAKALQEDLGISTWEKELDLYSTQISDAFYLKKRQVLDITEEKNGSKDTTIGLKLFFDPDEEYMALKAINPGQKAVIHEKSTGDGHAVISLDIKPESILTKFRNIKLLQ